MARLNTTAVATPVFTHEGGKAFSHLQPIEQLRRSVLSCLLWEKEYYEDGISIADRISATAEKVSTSELAALAVEARTVHYLRHVPLLLLCELAKRGGRVVGQTIFETISRPDELPELLVIYWRNGKRPLSAQMKIGTARAFRKFSAYQLSKWKKGDKQEITLKDVLFLSHAKPKNEDQATVWKQLVAGTLPPADTWEVALSAGEDKRETWGRLLSEGKLGYDALLKNLRNMFSASVDTDLVKKALLARKGAHRVQPFRYVAAARACPQWEPMIDQALLAALEDMPQLPGKTIVLVDVSSSMDAPLSGRSDLKRIDAAAALAAIIPAKDLRVLTFSNQLAECPPRRGMAGVDTIINSQPHGGTYLAAVLPYVNKEPHDRLIVITDEQINSNMYNSNLPDPVAKHAYMINVASAQNGVGYGRWIHLDGFSERVIKFIWEFENFA